MALFHPACSRRSKLGSSNWLDAEETNRLNRERRASGEGHRSQLAKIQRTLKQMLSAIVEGGHTHGMTERMRELEAREDVRKGFLAQEPADIPNVSGIHRAADGSAQHPRGSQ
jgi:hypothetical protein